MHNTSSKYLLQIHPSCPKSSKPCNDELTAKMERLLEVAKRGKPYKGCHKCICGERSSNYDLFVAGYTTNSLAAHYLIYHRNGIPKSEIEKLNSILLEQRMKQSRKKKLQKVKQISDKDREQFSKDLTEPLLTHVPAYINASDSNLTNGKYCYFCNMPWYNCLCCHVE